LRTQPQPEPLDRIWDDENVIPAELGPDTEFLFDRMTRDTMEAVGACPGARVLDVGCGRGLDLASLAGHGAILMGCDPSGVMVRRARETLEKRGLKPLVVCCSAENLPFLPESFDRVYCKGAIDHFYDPSRALREMTRVLRPGGRLVVSVANFESLGCRLGRLYNRLHRIFTGRELPRPHFWEIPKDHVYRFHRELLLGMMPGGARVVNLWGISLFWGFPGWGGILRRTPRGARKLLLDVVDRVGRVFPSLADVMVLRARKEGRAKASRQLEAAAERVTRGVDMNRNCRIQGALICGGTVVVALLFLIGLLVKSYWALAIPVAIGFLWLLGLAFWIGWTLLTIRVEPPRE
jgi:ubiquinone/menaquinone biosynthesis C-methylase UbiE